MLDRKAELRRKRKYWTLRRTQDIVLALFFLILLSPLFLLIVAIILVDDPHGSPIFTQIRCGRNAVPFKMYKFRTMYVDAEERLQELLKHNEMDGPAFKMKNDPRITRVGKILRKTSLDELPQLINVLRGDMSICGPRPPLPREVEQYTEYQFQRLYITPGLTCYWQVQPNRNELSFDEWVALDIRYIKERSFWVDIKIIFLTARAVLRGFGE